MQVDNLLLQFKKTIKIRNKAIDCKVLWLKLPVHLFNITSVIIVKINDRKTAKGLFIFKYRMGSNAIMKVPIKVINVPKVIDKKA